MAGSIAESIAVATLKGRVHRLIPTFILDDRWVIDTRERSSLKKFLIVSYPESSDGLIPEWNPDYEGKKVVWWSPSNHEKIKKQADYAEDLTREEKNFKKKTAARTLFKKAGLVYEFESDDRTQAVKKFEELTRGKE